MSQLDQKRESLNTAIVSKLLAEGITTRNFGIELGKEKLKDCCAGSKLVKHFEENHLAIYEGIAKNQIL